MSDILNKTLVLKLNKSWMAIDHMTVAEAITFLCSESGGAKPGHALDITTAVDENGDHVLVNAQPTSWDDWVKLPVREGDLSINSSRGPIRVPLVVICAHYDKVPMKQPRLSAAAVWERDGATCQYTGEKVTRSTGNLDHVTPRDRGGRDAWDNLVVARKDINTRKSNRLNHEVGLKLLRQPKAPAAVPPVVRLRADPKHPVWLPFLS
jgi:5-methylcytosine-specific restriction endonuclease McrA